METVDTKSLLDEYKKFKQVFDTAKSQLEEIKEKLKEENRAQGKNELILSDSEGVLWKCAFTTRKSKSVNYQYLMEVCGPEQYGDVVSENESVAYSVSKAPKNKKKQEEMPEKDFNSEFAPPKGVLS